MERIHYIYMTINNVNGKKYIGQRKCPKNITPEKDSYLGSGNLLIAAVKKYGRENFTKEILDICYCNKDADRLEKYYFDKYKVLENRDIFYNRALAGQYWRESGHSEYVSKKMKDFYSDPGNLDKVYISKYGMTKKEYEVEKLLKKIPKERRVALRFINKKINDCKKKRYNYYKNLHSDLRKEFYLEKNRQTQKEIWKTKRHDQEFLKAVQKGHENKKIKSGWKFSKEVRKKMSESKKGEKHVNYVKGINIKEILKYLENGLSTVEIGKIYNCSDSTVKDRLNKHGYWYNRKRKKFEHKDDNSFEVECNIILDLKKQGHTVYDIAKITGIKNFTIRNRLKYMGYVFTKEENNKSISIGRKRNGNIKTK